jgi:hypothetical protein
MPHWLAAACQLSSSHAQASAATSSEQQQLLQNTHAFGGFSAAQTSAS